MDADKTLEKLAAWQAGNQPMPLPPSAYTEDSVAELEKRRVLSNEWICVGHVSELKEPGDYLTFDLIDTPVIVTKNRANTLRAFSNVCAHRSARLLDGSGHCSAIVCPYHSWTYNLDGELRGAPFMEAWKIEGIRLTEVRLETWEGMIFANLDSEADALAPRLASLRQRIGGFGMSDMGVVWRFDDKFACNWKVLVENFCESYHVFRVHPETVEPDTPTSSVEVLPDGPGFNHHSMDYLANDNGIEKEHLSCIYPATALAVRHGTSIWLSVLPINASTCQVTGWLAESAREDDFASSIESTKAFLAEDKTIVEDMQKGLKSELGNCAPLNDMEKTNWQFGRYLADRLLNGNT